MEPINIEMEVEEVVKPINIEIEVEEDVKPVNIEMEVEQNCGTCYCRHGSRSGRSSW